MDISLQRLDNIRDNILPNILKRIIKYNKLIFSGKKFTDNKINTIRHNIKHLYSTYNTKNETMNYINDCWFKK